MYRDIVVDYSFVQYVDRNPPCVRAWGQEQIDQNKELYITL